VKEVDGVPCLQREDFDEAAKTIPAGTVFMLTCGECNGRLLFVEYLPRRRVLGTRCGNCNAVASSPILVESAAVAGGEIPVVAPPPAQGRPS